MQQISLVKMEKQNEKLMLELKNKNNDQSKQLEKQKVEEDLRKELLTRQKDKEKQNEIIQRLEQSLEIQLERENELKERLANTPSNEEINIRKKLIDSISNLQQRQQKDLEVMELKILELESINESLINKSKSEVGGENPDLKNIINNLKSDLKVIESKNQGTEILLKETQDQRDFLKKSFSELQTKYEQLILDKAHQEKDVIIARRECAELKMVVDSLEQRNKDITNRFEAKALETKSLLIRGEEEKKELNRENNKLINQLSTLPSMEQNIKLKDDIINLNKQLEEYQKIILKKESEYSNQVQELNKLLKIAQDEKDNTNSIISNRIVDATQESNEQLKLLKEENEKLRQSNDKLSDGALQFNLALKKHKIDISNLMEKEDELSNENLFLKSKIERLERKLYELLDNSELARKQETEQERIKNEILSSIIRT